MLVLLKKTHTFGFEFSIFEFLLYHNLSCPSFISVRYCSCPVFVVFLISFSPLCLSLSYVCLVPHFFLSYMFIPVIRLSCSTFLSVLYVCPCPTFVLFHIFSVLFLSVSCVCLSPTSLSYVCLVQRFFCPIYLFQSYICSSPIYLFQSYICSSPIYLFQSYVCLVLNQQGIMDLLMM